MKIDRLIGIIMTLLQQEKATAPELAQQFEVSRRTINRDIEDICKAGVPLVTIQGRGGGVSIAEAYKLDKTFFAPEELQAILTGLQGLDSVSKIPYFAQIVKKLSSRDRPVVPDSTILIDLASHYRGTLSEKSTPSGRRWSKSMSSPFGTTVRTVKPTGVSSRITLYFNGRPGTCWDTALKSGIFGCSSSTGSGSCVSTTACFLPARCRRNGCALTPIFKLSFL